jgi:hypothetical protein
MSGKELISRIEALSSKEKEHILEVLIQKEVGFSKNSNGYFFQFQNVSEDIKSEIETYVKLVESHSELQRNDIKDREYYLEYYKKEMDNRIKTKQQLEVDSYIETLRLISESGLRLVAIDGDLKVIKDPDDLMNAYIKSKFAYPKNSVYQRLHALIKKSKKSNKETNQEEIEGPDYNTLDNEDENGSQVGEIEEHEAGAVEEDEAEAGDVEESHCEDDGDEVEEYENVEAEVEADLEEHLDLDLHLTDGRKSESYIGIRSSQGITSSTRTVIDRFKTILREQYGYKFDDDKYVKLQRETYLILEVIN